jgi:hypothetical protein
METVPFLYVTAKTPSNPRKAQLFWAIPYIAAPSSQSQSIFTRPSKTPFVSSNHKILNLFGNLNTANGAESLLQVTVDGELTSGQGSDHEETGTDTGVGATETELLADLDQTGGGALTGEALGLVDLGKHGVGRLGNDSSSETSNETRAQVSSGLSAGGQVLLGEGTEDSLRGVRDPRNSVSAIPILRP